MNFLKPKFWEKEQISLFSIMLFPVALFVEIFNFLKIFFIKKYHFSIPTICVGNIYLGGTGKTPLCIEIFSILKKLNKNPAFIRKKYKSFQDEVNLLQRTGPLYEDKKRINAIKNAIKNKIDVLILDDGFQDFTINKNFYSIYIFNPHITSYLNSVSTPRSNHRRFWSNKFFSYLITTNNTRVKYPG